MKTTRALSLSFGFILALVVAAACSGTDDNRGTSGGTDAGVNDGGKNDGGQNDGGKNDGGKNDAGPQSCGDINFGAQACQSCAEGSCCAEMAACASGTACDDLNQCLGQCAQGDQTCQQTCANDHSGGVSDFNALSNCLQNSCNTECSAGSGQICDSGLTAPTPECGTCAGDKCCAEIKDCEADTTCLNCITGKTTSGCQQNTHFQAASTCLGNNCATECQ